MATQTEIYILLVLFAILCSFLLYMDETSNGIEKYQMNDPEDYTNGRKIDREKYSQESLDEDSETGCYIPDTKPFDYLDVPSHCNITCRGFDWVRCNTSRLDQSLVLLWNAAAGRGKSHTTLSAQTHTPAPSLLLFQDFLNVSKCKIREEIRKHGNIKCTLHDILFATDNSIRLSAGKTISGDEVYELVQSDHVKVICTDDSNRKKASVSWLWTGYVRGIRPVPIMKTVHHDISKDNFNVLIIVFGSTSKNEFIRRMPESYWTLKQDIEAVIMNRYNIMGDDTAAALFPLLTGLTVSEIRESRETFSMEHLDDQPFLFYKLRDFGYRTAYLEDKSKRLGTFQFKFCGFKEQPTHHYIRPFFLAMEDEKHVFRMHKFRYCIGDTPAYQIMLKASEQIFELDEKKFVVTFLSHEHNAFNNSSDKEFSTWLKNFKSLRYLNNTLLIVMGDHGLRFGKNVNTSVEKLEERLPLMAIRLPDRLISANPVALRALRYNAEVLTSPLDIHATLIDALNLTNVIEENSRANSLLEPISNRRSCSDASIDRHWCSCLKWENLNITNSMYLATVMALIDHINYITNPFRHNCELRTLISIEYVKRLLVNRLLLNFSMPQSARETYSVKVFLTPDNAIYEATTFYRPKKNKFEFNANEISRIDSYYDEPICIPNAPHLLMYCSCRQRLLKIINYIHL